jgi:aspartyl protease family protein
MGRGYLLFIVIAGMFGALVSTCSSGQMRSGDHVFVEQASRAGDETARSRSGGASSITSEGAIELPRSADGHFYADVDINGATIRMLVDTGATGIALSREDARTASIATSIGMNDVVGQGADGSVRGEYVRLDRVSLGSVSATGLDAVVLNSGEMSLLGQEFLSKFASVEIHGDTMLLK